MRLRKHGVCVLIVLLSLTSTVLIFRSVPFVRGNPRIIRVPLDYSTIQSAVAAANPGDEVLVSSGTYNGTVLVNKSLSLVGVGAGVSIIDARGVGPGVNVTAATGVVVSGFTIRNTDIVDSGVLISGSSNITISNNLIQASSQSNGTYLTNSYAVSVTGNNITGNTYGISVQGGSANLIIGNNVTGNSADGIGIFSSEGNKISDNQFRKSAKGLELNFGASGNLIARNTVSNNTFGFWIQNATSNVIVENNIDFNNRPSPSTVPTGMRFSTTSGNMIYYNNIRNNTAQVYADAGGDIVRNTWNDAGARPKGNFWSDYPGTDADMDGIGDTMLPWPCPTGPGSCSYSGPAGVDHYPLMKAWKSSPLTVSASVKPASGCPGSQGLLVSLATSPAKGGISPYSYSWSLGDGGSTSGQNVTHSYASGGSFFPKVTAIDNTGMANGTDFAVVTVFSGGVQLKISDPSGGALAGASISSVSQPTGQTGFSLTSDSAGLGKIACLVPGGYKVQVSDIGYLSKTVSFTVANMTVIVPVTLVSVPSTFPYTLVLYGVLGVAIAGGLVGFYFFRRRKA